MEPSVEREKRGDEEGRRGGEEEKGGARTEVMDGEQREVQKNTHRGPKSIWGGGEGSGSQG